MMRFDSLAEWLRWQETLHPREIELGLDRVRAVADRLGLLQPACPVVTVGGTNGKGSTLASLEAIYSHAGYRTGLYTSPHLIRYNERIRIEQCEAGDAGIMAAFAAIDVARGDISLTYFEFGTLAALWLFARAQVDVMLLEVGLGGRLDAVNILDADVAVVTSIGLDHMDWLGETRDLIAREKAGIFRAGRPAICGDPDPPPALAAAAAECGAHWYALDRAFGSRRSRDGYWDWWSLQHDWQELPLPALGGGVQLHNAAAALMAVECLQSRLPVARGAIAGGLATAVLAGRCQQLTQDGIELVLDVAHNAEAAAALAAWLAAHPAAGRTRAVYAGLADKDVRSVLAPLLPGVDCWYVGSLSGSRARHADSVLPLLVEADAAATGYDDVAAAWHAARADSRPDDRILVFGSFLTVGEVLRLLESLKG
ncbi:MAG: bifunctional tetrahydrofolate synthase/dihydrofolate synthase [Gammaproteobacteria bacterium]|nr:bifunctional tetrahydrofolate synthase/dihydrofolate synthase [Gammaproteobacteria bacterium]